MALGEFIRKAMSAPGGDTTDRNDDELVAPDVAPASDNPMYLFGKDNLPGIAADLVPPRLFEGTAFTEWSASDRREHALFFLGPAHSGAYFHQHFSAWNALLYGAKRWFLLPPDAVFGPYTASMVNWLAVDKSRLPIPPLECVQESGEILFVPEGWLHATINLQDSVGIAVELGPTGNEGS
jgi:hypothetical protein